jgi:hypothetical protein
MSFPAAQKKNQDGGKGEANFALSSDMRGGGGWVEPNDVELGSLPSNSPGARIFKHLWSPGIDSKE